MAIATVQQQHSIDMMKKQGLKLEAQDLYNPNGISLKDAVGIFGGGCTGEIISPEGLILTNLCFWKCLPTKTRMHVC